MPVIDLRLDGDGCWADLADPSKTVIDLMGDEHPIHMAALKGGMSSGKTAVAIRIDLPGGRSVITQTSLDLLETAVTATRAAYPGP